MTFSRLVLSVVLLSSCSHATKAGPKNDNEQKLSPCGLKKCYVIGNDENVVKPTSPGFLLVGGGTDIDAAMEWLIAKSGGGDFVVIRSTGDDDYNPYIKALGSLDSVETLIIDSRNLASNSYVLDRVRNAEGLFIAGGDQSDYIKYWQSTPLEAEINARVAHGVPMGGTSAGLAVLGQYIYSAYYDSAVSTEVLANPYSSNVTLARDFLNVPWLKGLITDSHFVARDRMGRLLGFMGRIVADGWNSRVKAIGIDEETALALELDGDVSLFGSGAVYFLQRSGMPEVCSPKKPLKYKNISVYKIRGSESFNLSTWTGKGGKSYELSAEDGGVVSTIGSIY